MNRRNNISAGWLAGCLVVLGVAANAAANLPTDWQYDQPFTVANAGLVKIGLPLATLDTARSALEDLRLYDDAGNEVPYLIDRPAPRPKAVQAAKSFQVSLTSNFTVITLETGLSQPLESVTLETPALNFIKAARVEGSSDGRAWQSLAEGRPIFRQPSGAEETRIYFPPRTVAWLRLTVDDQRTGPIPFTGTLVQAAQEETVPVESIPVTITERNENPGESRLALGLGAANLNLVSLRIETDEPLFLRPVALAVPQVSDGAIREQTIARGTLYRVAVAGQTPSERLALPLEQQVRSQELLLLIKNGDSPPLPISAVRAERRPIYLVFLARQPGSYHLLSGNPRCSAPRYDLSALGMNLRNIIPAAITLPPPAGNPGYRAPEVLAGLPAGGVPLDISSWRYRKPMLIAAGGAQQVELDLDVLAHSQPGNADLRVMLGSNQVPYLLVRTSISRPLNPIVTLTNDARNPKLSRWSIQLPRPGLSLTHLTCTTLTPLFSRSVSLSEELAGERGEPYRHALGSALWEQTPDHKPKEFSLTLDSPVQSDTLVLETENGENPPIVLDKVQTFYNATRIVFKARTGDSLFLYYGHPRIGPPRYDLDLVADQLLMARKNVATLLTEEQLHKSSWSHNGLAGPGGMLFWGVLAVVVVGLLIIIARLLPAAPPTPPPTS